MTRRDLPFDPDPRYVDDLVPSAEYVEGYDAGWTDCELARPRLLQVTAFGYGVLVGMVLAAILFLGAAGVR